MPDLPPVPPLPPPCLTYPADGLSMLLPLSRAGRGPGMIILLPKTTKHTHGISIENGIPSLLYKWAEESYSVVQIEEAALEKNADEALQLAVAALLSCETCEPKANIGVVAYSTGCWNLAAAAINGSQSIRATAIYSSAEEASKLINSTPPSIHHYAGKTSSGPLKRSDNLVQYEYPAVQKADFAIPFHAGFDYRTEAITHTRNLTHLKRHMNGPYFDLESIWDEHAYYEFEARSVEHTMSTMVQEPYVNHVPTLTGGIGREKLTEFYRDHFIFSNPRDTEMELISRTIGIDRVVDEFIFKLTHTQEIDWLLPGIPPTGKSLHIPFTAIVNIRGDRLFHEHIAWDQATALRQLGILPTHLPASLSATGQESADQIGTQLRLPVTGVETAEKLSDKNSVPSNTMISNWK